MHTSTSSTEEQDEVASTLPRFQVIHKGHGLFRILHDPLTFAEADEAAAIIRKRWWAKKAYIDPIQLEGEVLHRVVVIAKLPKWGWFTRRITDSAGPACQIMLRVTELKRGFWIVERHGRHRRQAHEAFYISPPTAEDQLAMLQRTTI